MEKSSQNKRKMRILRMLVDEYVGTVEPVGSEVLRRKNHLEWSPATIRNDFCVLEDEGYIAKQHVSGGRVPTNRAYCWMRDVYMDGDTEHLRMKEALGETKTLEALRSPMPIRYTVAASVLANATRHWAFAGALERGIFSEFGLSSLVREPEFTEQQTIAEIASFVERFTHQTGLVLERLAGNGLDVYVGEENPFSEAGACSLLVATFRAPEGGGGFVGMMGPTRMRYGRNIAFMEEMTRTLGV